MEEALSRLRTLSSGHTVPEVSFRLQPGPSCNEGGGPGGRLTLYPGAKRRAKPSGGGRSAKGLHSKTRDRMDSVRQSGIQILRERSPHAQET